MRIFFSVFLLFIVIPLKAQENPYAVKQVADLQKALRYYEKINSNDWMYFSCDSCVNPGNRSQMIPLLRKDLLLTGDLSKEENTGEELLDTLLENALKKFQRRNGLKDDGVLGSKTIEALNVPFSSRIATIRSNIEKWQDFSQESQERFILVNIPDFSLSIIDNGSVTQSMKVIIGRLTHPTPLFGAELSYLVANPSWLVPYSISVNEILPMLKTDPLYLKRNHMEVYTYYKGSKVKINPDTVNWTLLTKDKLRYQFEQTPGTWNALGKIKFILPNEYNVYLHDTPEKHLFSHQKRTYSHGCVRVEKPEELAAWLLKKSKQEIIGLISSSNGNTIIQLQNPVFVYIDYFTSWIDEDGLLQFRENIYNYSPQ